MNYNESEISLKNTLLSRYDLYLCSAGYEERTLGCLQNIQNNTKFSRALINLFKPDDPDLLNKNLENLEKIKTLLSPITEESKVFEIMPNNPSDFNDMLMKNLGNVESILIDVTSFTRLFLYSILNICIQKRLKVHLAYSEPQDYTMNFAQGLEEIVIMPTNPGIPDQSKKILMVLFLGWEHLRLGSVIEEWEPDKIITLAEYSEGEREKWNQITIKQCQNIIDKSDFTRVPALNPKETLAKLEEIYSQYSADYDICLVNGGPKVHCFAFSEFAFKYPEIQLLYAKPYKWQQELPSDEPIEPTSKQIGNTFIFNFPIGTVLEKSLSLN